MTKYLVTGATGQLGQFVIQALRDQDIAAGDIALLVRSESAAEALNAQGFDAKVGTYDDVETLKAAFDGVDRMLLISSSEIGKRAEQHSNVITAAESAGVKFIAYTSILRAAENPMALAGEHKATEAALAATPVASTVLRNGWYTENLVMALPQILEGGQHYGAAAEGKFSTATRQDYAQAAAAVLTGEGHEGRTYELGGDTAYTLGQFAQNIAELSGKDVAYVDMPEAAFTEALVGAGLPQDFAGILSDSDAHAANGWLETQSSDLSTLIGRATTPVTETLKAALAA